MKDFAAIDFETANSQRSSVCSVGVVIVRGGRITDKIYRLIRPAPNYYSRWTTEIHGLTRSDTDSAADFPEVWAEIAPLIEGLPLVAHNSPFDEGCLRAAFERWGWPAARPVARSAASCPITSSTPSPNGAATISCATTTLWPTPKPAPA